MALLGSYCWRIPEVDAREMNTQRTELLEALLKRCLPIIDSDALMMADITRFMPLPPEEQAKHDSTESDSERLQREIRAALGIEWPVTK